MLASARLRSGYPARETMRFTHANQVLWNATSLGFAPTINSGPTLFHLPLVTRRPRSITPLKDELQTTGQPLTGIHSNAAGPTAPRLSHSSLKSKASYLRFQLCQVANHLPAFSYQVIQMVLETFQLLNGGQRKS